MGKDEDPMFSSQEEYEEWKRHQKGPLVDVENRLDFIQNDLQEITRKLEQEGSLEPQTITEKLEKISFEVHSIKTGLWGIGLLVLAIFIILIINKL